MNARHCFAAIASAILLSGSASAAQKTGHDAYLASVASYGPMQAFNEVFDGKRFVGYFLTRGDACAVTVMVAMADDEALTVAPQRVRVDIPAAGRTEIAVGNGDAVAIGCTVDADKIKVAKLTLPPVKSASR